jgi:hypothetical protein
MGTRKQRQGQEQLWVTHTELAEAPGHRFYKRLNELLDGEKFDEFCERECAQFYAKNNGRPSLTPGTYFRLLLVGYFEGIDSERGIAWRTADSLGLREFLRIGLDEETPQSFNDLQNKATDRCGNASQSPVTTSLSLAWLDSLGSRRPPGRTWPASTGSARRRHPIRSG